MSRRRGRRVWVTGWLSQRTWERGTLMRHFLFLAVAEALLSCGVFPPSPGGSLIALLLCTLPGLLGTGGAAVAIPPITAAANVDVLAAFFATVASRRVQRDRTVVEPAGQNLAFGTNCGADRVHLRVASSGNLAGQQPTSRFPFSSSVRTPEHRAQASAPGGFFVLGLNIRSV